MFDTLAYAKKLKQVGFSDSQAEAIAEGYTDHAYQNLSTKEDLSNLKENMSFLRAGFREDVTNLEISSLKIRDELEQNINSLGDDIAGLTREFRITKWLLFIIMGGVAAYWLNFIFEYTQ